MIMTLFRKRKPSPWRLLKAHANIFALGKSFMRQGEGD